MSHHNFVLSARFSDATVSSVFHSVLSWLLRYSRLKTKKNFGDLPGIFIYIDDILITAKTEQEHDENLKRVVERAKQQKLQYKVSEVKFLGHIFNSSGVSVDPNRVKAIVEMEEPTSKKELQRYLGMINYLRSFVPNMAQLTEPLRPLLRKGIEFAWLPIHSKSVKDITDHLSRTPVLQPFHVNKNITIQTDSSQYGLGSVLMQDRRPISYASRCLTDTEVN